jgi:iron complex transport system substrate-binding protein
MRRTAAVVAALIAGFAAAACGNSGGAVEPSDTGVATTVAAATGTAATSGAPSLPVTVIDSTGTEVTIASVDRIVPVDGDIAEIVFALGLGDRVVATDISATYPPEVDGVPDIGYQRALNAEPIAAVEPSVVLATDLARPVETLEQLRMLGIPVVVIEREISLAGPAAKIRAVAEALGVPGRGELLATAVQTDIDAAVAAALDVSDRPRVLPLYLRGESVQLILGKGTGIDAVLPAVGATDVAAELGIVDTRQITAEALLLAKPDVLLVTTTGLESVGGIDGLLAIPGIAETPAGQQRRIIAHEDQFLLGGGPRTGQLMRQLVAELHPAGDIQAFRQSSTPPVGDS